MKMRALPRIAMVLLLALPALAVPGDESLEQLKAKAAASSGGDRAVLYAEVARQEVELANQHFTDGNVDQGHAAVREVVAYARKAATAARNSKKKLKETEMSLRQTARRLSDIGATLAVDDRPAVEQAVKDIYTIEDQLLEVMFGGGKT
jgi:hypothetical protein